ncbi:enoyl-CoA hydratase-related protein [Streptomyces sp. NPDC051018]|uniref:enoyl-CoA hydratase-related protein n=1 Tax=Streptomyces sp. NPDC051018 TaxID=3365639 RepID=UPI0037B69EAF
MPHVYAYESLLVERTGRLLKVTLNRPEALNAVGAVMHRELDEFFREVRFDSSVGAILLTGAGRAFSSGGDVKFVAGEAAADKPRSNGAQRVGKTLLSSKSLITNMLDVEQPIVCAVQGFAMGLGATIALCADVVLAAEDAVLADTHVDIGVVAGDGGAVIWPLLLPINTAKYYLMTGDRLTGKDVERLGLVLKAVPAGELDAEALAIAERLANGPTLAIRWTKTAVNKALRERANLLFDTSLLLEGATFLSDDHKEAAAAFMEKREPKFQGR